MNTNSFTRTILSIIVGLFLVAGASVAQTFKNGGTLINNSGKTITAPTFQNFGGATPGVLHNGGTVSVSGTFTNGSGTQNSTFNNYYSVGGTAVVGTFVQNSSVNASNDSATAIGYLKVTAATPFTLTTGTVSTTHGKVEFGGTGAQAVAAFASGYGTLIASGTGVKTLAAPTAINDSARISGAVLKVSGATLTVNGSGIVVTTPATDTVDASTGAAVNYAANASQSVAPGTYDTLITSNSTSAHAKASPGDLNILVKIAVGSNDSLDIKGLSSNFRASGVTTFANNGTIKIQGNAFFTAGITAGNFAYYGAAQSIGGAIYSDLAFSGAGAKTFNGNTTVNGTYDVSGQASGGRNYTTNSVVFTYNGASPQTVVAGTSGAHEAYFTLAFTGAGAKSIPAAGYVDATTVQLTSGGAVTNSATLLQVSTGGLTNAITFANAGPLTVAGAGATGFTNNGTVNNTNTITLNTSDFNNNGTLANDGTITVN